MLTLPILLSQAAAASTATSAVLGRVHQDAVIRVGLDMLLEILRTLEGLAAEIALVRLQGDVYTDM